MPRALIIPGSREALLLPYFHLTELTFLLACLLFGTSESMGPELKIFGVEVNINTLCFKIKALCTDSRLVYFHVNVKHQMPSRDLVSSHSTLALALDDGSSWLLKSFSASSGNGRLPFLKLAVLLTKPTRHLGVPIREFFLFLDTGSPFPLSTTLALFEAAQQPPVIRYNS